MCDKWSNSKFDVDFEEFREEHQNINRLTAKGYTFLFKLYKYESEQYIQDCLSKYPDDSNCITCLAFILRPNNHSRELFEKAIKMNNASAISLYFYCYNVYTKNIDKPLCQTAIEMGDSLAPFIMAMNLTWASSTHPYDEYDISDEIYKLYELAASRGLGEAKYKLANIHSYSKNRYDPEKAIQYLKDIGDDNDKISIRDNAQIAFILDIVNSRDHLIDQLTKQTNELKAQINELYYQPGGPGYNEALNHFNELI